MSKVRLLQVIASSRGGGAVHVRDLVRGLDPARYDIQVALPDDGGSVSAGDLRGAGAAVHVLPLERGLSLRALSALRRLAQNADLMHVHGPRAAFCGRLAAATLGSARPRVVYTVHAFAAPHYRWPASAVLLALERASARYTDAVIAVAQAQRSELLAAKACTPERITVVHNGIDLPAPAVGEGVAQARQETRRRLGLPADARVATMVCRLYRPRDFETLLIAFRQVREELPGARLLIVGDGPYRARVEDLVDGLWLSQQVILAGQRDDVPALLAASDLLVHATVGWEGMNLSILEAMAAGLPVVASRVGGIPEAVVDGETGLLVTPRSPAELARALLRLLGDPGEAARLGAKGLARVRALFGVPREIAETEAVYAQVLGGGPAPKGAGG
ncbi:MAG: glycosyltransferase family 4 protein [Chloroflexi bacterium]|nr:glycosyltransferase family 4 protein [Chloroflexota bacterium]